MEGKYQANEEMIIMRQQEAKCPQFPTPHPFYQKQHCSSQKGQSWYYQGNIMQVFSIFERMISAFADGTPAISIDNYDITTG